MNDLHVYIDMHFLSIKKRWICKEVRVHKAAASGSCTALQLFSDSSGALVKGRLIKLNRKCVRTDYTRKDSENTATAFTMSTLAITRERRVRLVSLHIHESQSIARSL